MLSKEDKQDIQNLIIQIMTAQAQKQAWQQQKEDPHKGATQNEREKIKQQESRNERKEYLQKLRDKDKDNLAQRIEYEKLRLLDNIPNSLKTAGTVAKTGGKFVGSAAKELGTLTGDVLGSVTNSKLGKSITQSILYSNPLTAVIAMNSGLIGGVAKGALNLTKFGFNTLKKGGSLIGKGADWLYRKTRNPINDEESSANDLLEQKENMNALGGTNYISTKKATFLGGTNNILILNGKSGGAFSLNLPTEEFQSISSKKGNKQISTQPIALLPDKQKQQNIENNTFSLISTKTNKKDKRDDDIIEMTKGINGIYAQTQATTKILDKITKKQLLIAGGVFLAVGALFLAVKLLMDKFNDKPSDKPLQNTVPSKIKDVEIFNKNQDKIKNTNKQQIINDITKSNKGISSYNTKKEAGEAIKGPKLAADTNRDVNIGAKAPITEFKATPEEPYLLIQDGTFIKMIRTEKEDEFHCIFRFGKGGIKQFVARNVVKPYLFCKKDKFMKRGSQIGFINEAGLVAFANLSDTSDNYNRDYMNLVNKNAETKYRDQAQSFDKSFNDKEIDKLIKTQKNQEDRSKIEAEALNQNIRLNDVKQVVKDTGLEHAKGKGWFKSFGKALKNNLDNRKENTNKINLTNKTLQESKDTQKQIDKAKQPPKKTEDNKSNNSSQILSLAPKQSNNIFFSPATTSEEKIRHADITSLC